MEGYQIIERVAIPAIIGIAMYVIFILILKSNTKEWKKNLNREHIVVHLPKAYLWIGIFCTAVCIGFIVLGCLESKPETCPMVIFFIEDKRGRFVRLNWAQAGYY